MLLLSGVLLVLGFVILGTALVQLQGMEGTTERTQRDNVMRTAEELVAGLNQTIQDSLVIGETNTTSFQETLRGAEASFRDNAVRAGLYASVQLVDVKEEPDRQDIFRQSSRCIGWNEDASNGGIIVGWEAETFEESIAGAVYHIHLTDGKQSFRTDLYVKLLNCADVEVYSHMRDAQPQPVFGVLDNHTHSRQGDGMFLNLTETEGDELVDLETGPTIIDDSVTTNNWNQPKGIQDPDMTEAKYVSSGQNVTNFIRWRLEPPPIMQAGDELSDVEVMVNAWHNQAPSILRPEILYLRVYYPYDSVSPNIVENITLTKQPTNITISLPEGPSGSMNWTYDEIINSRFQFTVVKELGLHNPGREIYVNYFNMTGGMMTFAGYRMDSIFEWQQVPPIYEEHVLHLRYNVTDATEGEEFSLMVRDAAVNGSPWSIVYNMTTTYRDDLVDDYEYCDIVELETWREVECWKDENGTDLPNHPEFRIVDSIHQDNWPVLDQDSVRIDLMRLISRLTEM